MDELVLNILEIVFIEVLNVSGPAIGTKGLNFQMVGLPSIPCKPPWAGPAEGSTQCYHSRGVARILENWGKDNVIACKARKIFVTRSHTY